MQKISAIKCLIPKSYKLKASLGFTIIELFVVLAIIVVLVSISTGLLVILRQDSKLNIDAQRIVSALRLAQNRTTASRNLNSHGVHFDIQNNIFILFEGPVFDSQDPSNESVNLESGVQFSNIQLDNSGEDIIFNRITGSTLQGGFVEIQSADLSDSRTICIEESGSAHTLDLGQSAGFCRSVSLEYTGGITAQDLASFPSNSGFGDPAQSFVTDAALSLSRVELLLSRQLAPSNIFLEIRQSSTVGAVLGASNIVQGSTLPQSASWVSFVFSKPVALNGATQYFMRLRSLPDSTIPFSGAQGVILWSYMHSASAPPAYGGGDAWRYIGRNNNPVDAGQRLGPQDQYDFSFRLVASDPPTQSDSRHLEFDLGFSLRDTNTLSLSFSGGVTNNINIVNFMNASQTSFIWEGQTQVSGTPQTIRIASSYIDDNDTILSIVRDARLNNASLTISADGKTIVSYTATGEATKGAGIDRMTFR